jgi:hypothetical protein
MIIVYQFFRAGLALVTNPRDALAAIRESTDPTAQRRAEMNEVVQFALQTLKDNSPVGSGRDPHPGLYRDSHTLFINGDDVADLSSWQPGDEVEISNPVPYEKILELGDFKVRVPHHTYELTRTGAAAKYGDIVRIELPTCRSASALRRKWSATAARHRSAAIRTGRRIRRH